jgi:hypothetical protein
MSNSHGEPEYLSRGRDYLESLASDLRELQGFATLANELIQNADDPNGSDARGAGRISFCVTKAALIVDNDGVFSDCGHVKENSCPWKDDPSRGFMCDFHGFRTVASGHKRRRSGSSGAFGIGFTSVYQITDQPELLSAGRHWIVHEDRPEHERIRVCRGCPTCQSPELPATRFVLPWALDPNSELRKALATSPITPESPYQILADLTRALPTAILFLKNLNSIELLDDRKTVLSIQRVVDKGSLLVSDGTKDRVWHLLRGDFHDQAKQLRERHANRIEPKRTSNVMLAIPDEPLDRGLLCACLPTQEDTGLPFHINADFFPNSDRKRIILGQDYQSEWNRAAIGAAANVIRDKLQDLPQLLGHQHLWHVFETIQKVGNEVKSGHKDQSLGLFWDRLQPQLSSARVFYTSQKKWEPASNVYFLREKEEEDVVPVLEGLGLSLLHPGLRRYQNIYSSKEVGVQRLDIGPIADALEAVGLNQRVEIAALPEYLKSDKARRLLRRELALLLARQRQSEDQKAVERKLSRCAVVPGRDKALWPCRDIYRAESETVMLFSGIDPNIPFLGSLEEDAIALEQLCPEFSAAVAIECLSKTLVSGEAEESPPEIDPVSVLRWFENRGAEVQRNNTIKHGLAALPLFPSAEGLKPLTLLSLPGNFTPPVGLAGVGVVDLAQLKGRRDFLRELGAQELTFTRYARDHVPQAFRNEQTTPEQKRKVVQLLAERVGEIRDDGEICDALTEIPLVECIDGHFRRPGEVYFDDDVVRVVLGDAVPLAKLPKSHESAVRDLYGWLSVANSPRFDAISNRIRALTASPPTDELVDAIGIIFRHLSQRLWPDEKNNPALLQLRNLSWLPARGDRQNWHRPGELYAVFQDYLFDSQVKFLDLPREIQNSRNLLDFLFVKVNPTTTQVVKHLLKCSESNTPVNKEVFRYLNDNAADRALDALQDKRCLLLPDSTYVKPSHVFWGEHPFGRYRHRLSPDLRKYADLFTRLGVDETPSHEDAFAVLREISDEFGPPNRLLDDNTYSILIGCWQRLERALHEGLVAADELAALSETLIVPDVRPLLSQPAKMFFEDRPGLSTKFKGYLDNDVIPRPQGAWRAMQEAGVRLLSKAIRTHLLECRDPVSDEALLTRIRDRRQQLLRVIESDHDASGPHDIGLIDRLECRAVQELQVQYSVKAFNHEWNSDPESLPAKFHSADGVLYFVRHGDSLPWPSISRELALALCPEADPGRMAAGIKEVLAANTDKDAGSVLDELGFAPIAMVDIVPDEPAGMIEDLGGEDAPPAPDPTQPATPIQLPIPRSSAGTTESGSTPAPTSTGGGALAGTDGQPLSPEDAINRILGPDGGTTTSLPPELEKQLRSRPDGAVNGHGSGNGQPTDGKQQSGSGTQTRDGDRRPARGGYPVLRSYVSHTNPNDDREADPVQAERREKVNRSGMEKVLAFEVSQGRHPREMPPLHPGYDVESDNDQGHVERHIEVKSLSGDWEGPHAGMSDTQFQKNQEIGNGYWLYVVERADQPDYRIWRIQDPAQQVTNFMYDGGWKNIAEDDEMPAEAKAEQAGNDE